MSQAYGRGSALPVDTHEVDPRRHGQPTLITAIPTKPRRALPDANPSPCEIEDLDALRLAAVLENHVRKCRERIRDDPHVRAPRGRIACRRCSGRANAVDRV